MLWNDWLNSWRRPAVRRRLESGVDRDRCRSIERLEPRCLLSATAAIEGTVFNDLNESSQFDDGDRGLSGWTVFVDSNGNTLLDLEQFQAESNAPVEIPDRGQGVSTFEVSDVPGTIADIVVLINISHTFSADMRAVLVSPSGSRVELFQGVGNDSSAGFQSTFFEDDAEFAISSPEASSPFTGSFRPNEPLRELAGESPNGTWKLEVTDGAFRDSGTITLFHITIGLAGPNSEQFAISDETGAYQIDGLDSGTYTVQEVRQRGYFQRFPETVSQTITVNEGQTATDIDFGNVAAPGAIFGQVWDDLDGDGLHDLNEPGSDGWTIELLDADTLEVISDTISISIDLDDDGQIDPLTETGLYQFAFVRPGNYLVREMLQEGWKETAPLPDNSVVGDHPIVQAGSFEVTAPPTGTDEAPAPWLPDLIVDMENLGGLRNAFLDGNILRFGQASPNVGDGPMRLVGGADNGDGTQQVAQRIFDDHGGYTDRLAGNFSFHPEHNHIHFNGFAEYSLRAVLPDDNNDGTPEVGDIIRGGTKTSFCLINVEQYSTDPPLPNADPDGSGFFCDTQQEISVGWEDIYPVGTEGQEINVGGLEPGDYWLEATVDPDNHFAEKDDANNTGRILIHLGPARQAHRVTIDPGREVNGRNFGNFRQITVSGTVFNDANSNGRRNVRENELAHVAVFIDTNGDHILNNPTSGDGVADGLAQEPWALTDENGDFQVTGLNGGTYQVRIVAPHGQIQTTETPPSYSAISGVDVNIGSFGIGVRPGSTTQVTLADDGHIVVNDISVRGQNDRLTVSVEGFLFAAEQQQPSVIPQVRIHDPDHILTTTVGVQEGLHTVFIPITESIASNLIEINGGDGNDVLTVDLKTSPGMALINGGNGNDTIAISGGSRIFPFALADHGDVTSQIKNHDDTGEELLGSLLDQIGLFETSTINGGSGNDRIITSNSFLGVILNGDDGNDSVVGGKGDDCLQGGSGNDTLSGGDGSDQLSGGDGADQLRGDKGQDTLHGDWGNDQLEGGADSDLFLLSDGDDLDTVNGGLGFDTVIVQGTPMSESFRVGSLGSLVKFQRTNSTRLAVEIKHGESLIVRGLAGNDRMAVGANAAMIIGVSFEGGLGDDTLQLNGTSNNDNWQMADFDHFLVHVNIPRSVAVTNVSADTEHVLVNLGAGNDAFSAENVYAQEVQITVRGESGNDTINGGAGADSLLGDDGNDLLTGGDGNDRVFGETGNDALFGGAGADYLAGGSGVDDLHGDAGADTITGGEGDDILNGNDGDDLLNGDRGNDALFGGNDNDALIGLDGNDRLDGQVGNDTLIGGTGNDQLSGGDGIDLLFGNDGNDRLDGQAGKDTLVGGSGQNSFIHPVAGEIVAVFRFNLQRLLDQF